MLRVYLSVGDNELFDLQVSVLGGDPDDLRHVVRQQRRLLQTQGQDRARRYSQTELLRARRGPPHAAQCVQPGKYVVVVDRLRRVTNSCCSRWRWHINNSCVLLHGNRQVVNGCCIGTEGN